MRISSSAPAEPLGPDVVAAEAQRAGAVRERRRPRPATPPARRSRRAAASCRPRSSPGASTCSSGSAAVPFVARSPVVNRWPRGPADVVVRVQRVDELPGCSLSSAVRHAAERGRVDPGLERGPVREVERGAVGDRHEVVDAVEAQRRAELAGRRARGAGDRAGVVAARGVGRRRCPSVSSKPQPPTRPATAGRPPPCSSRGRSPGVVGAVTRVRRRAAVRPGREGVASCRRTAAGSARSARRWSPGSTVRVNGRGLLLAADGQVEPGGLRLEGEVDRLGVEPPGRRVLERPRRGGQLQLQVRRVVVVRSRERAAPAGSSGRVRVAARRHERGAVCMTSVQLSPLGRDGVALPVRGGARERDDVAHLPGGAGGRRGDRGGRRRARP